MVGLPSTVHHGVQQFGLDAYFRPLTDDLVRGITAYEGSTSMDWEAVRNSVDGRCPSLVAWAPWLQYKWQEGIVHDVAPERMAVEVPVRWPPGGALRFRIAALKVVTACSQVRRHKWTMVEIRVSLQMSGVGGEVVPELPTRPSVATVAASGLPVLLDPGGFPLNIPVPDAERGGSRRAARRSASVSTAIGGRAQ